MAAAKVVRGGESGEEKIVRDRFLESRCSKNKMLTCGG